ncbi:FAD-dependent oxidoreductase [Candidatus Pacearchaeota archaeon]|nr:FAD-dependent oxidoreductase [Candidatus Pacearchaeota archaeon]
MKISKTYDLIIIGAGPAGLTAALYAARYKVNVLVIGMLHGGTATEAHKVCNFPSYENVGGVELMLKMIKQVKNLKVEIKQEEVININRKDLFKIVTNKEEYSSKKIIIATGSKRMKLGVEREEELTGKGIHYCTTCDAGFYKAKTVGVVGGGNAALTSALLLAKIAKKVYVIYRRDKFFKAEPMWVDEVKKEKKIVPVFNSKVLELIGKNKLEEVEIKQVYAPPGVPPHYVPGARTSNEVPPDTQGGHENLQAGMQGGILGGKKIKLDGLFIEIGGISNIKLAKLLGIKLERNYIKVDKEQKTNVEGVFAAGDVTNNCLKQIVTACGEGAVAGFSVFRDLRK